MKKKVSVRDMVLGAGIMLVGLGIGAIVSPPLIAQRYGVFGEIQCTRLTVVDESGNKAIVLAGGDGGEYEENHLSIYYPQGEEGIRLGCFEPGTSTIQGFNRNRGDGFDLIHYATGTNTLRLWNKELGGTDNHPAIELECNKKENRVFVRDRRFEWGKSFRTRKNIGAGMAIGLHSHLWGNEIFVVNPHTGTTRTLEDR